MTMLDLWPAAEHAKRPPEEATHTVIDELDDGLRRYGSALARELHDAGHSLDEVCAHVEQSAADMAHAVQVAIIASAFAWVVDAGILPGTPGGPKAGL